MNNYSPVKRLNYHFKSLESILRINDYFLGVRNYKNKKIKKNENIDFMKKYRFISGFLEIKFFNIESVKTTNNIDNVEIEIALKYIDIFYKNKLKFSDFKEAFKIFIFDIQNEYKNIDNIKVCFDRLFHRLKFHFSLKEEENVEKEVPLFSDDENDLKELLLKMKSKREIVLGIDVLEEKLKKAQQEYNDYEKISKEILAHNKLNKDKIYLYNEDYEKNISKGILEGKYKELKIPEYKAELFEKRKLLTEYLKGVEDYYTQLWDGVFK